jgi:hypothetical protein
MEDFKMSAFQILVRPRCRGQERNIAENGFFKNINFPEIYPIRRYQNAQTGFVKFVTTKSS